LFDVDDAQLSRTTSPTPARRPRHTKWCRSCVPGRPCRQVAGRRRYVTRPGGGRKRAVSVGAVTRTTCAAHRSAGGARCLQQQLPEATAGPVRAGMARRAIATYVTRPPCSRRALHRHSPLHTSTRTTADAPLLSPAHTTRAVFTRRQVGLRGHFRTS